ncbi:MAG: nucleoside monophosphate kinase [Candidatus Paceibacterota bacterium]|jgi:adenylate kinase family enzyme
MKGIDFPIFKTKMSGAGGKKFDLTDSAERRKYFELKAGKEIKKLREYLKKKTFVAYLLGKKNSGKGTYAKMLQEIVDPKHIEHVSIGDMVRKFDEVKKDKKKKKEFVSFIENNYRGYSSPKDIIDAFLGRSTKNLLPSELILALMKKEMAEKGRKAIFIDGFPRELDQISYTLFLRDLIDYRNDPDVFILIDVPEKVIDERIKYRLICPLCQTSRSSKLLPTKNVYYDEKTKSFGLICDNAGCKGAKMVTKEGDQYGTAPIKDRLVKDEDLMRKVNGLHGVPKIFLRNAVPVAKAKQKVDGYELTPEYVYEVKNGKVVVTEKPWQVTDDEGNPSFSLMPPPVVVSLIKQLVKALGL